MPKIPTNIFDKHNYFLSQDENESNKKISLEEDIVESFQQESEQKDRKRLYESSKMSLAESEFVQKFDKKKENKDSEN
jgi:hypothetical protein